MVAPEAAAAAQLDALRDELKTLKDEQRDRIRARDGLVYSVIVAVAAVAGGAKFGGDGVALLLPPVALTLGWTYLASYQKISAIGAYLRTDLGPRLSALTGGDALRWESVHRGDRRRRQRKIIQLAVDLVVFVLPAAVAVGWYWVSGTVSPVLLVASVLEAASVLVAGWQIVAYADILDCKPEVA
jgi:hypothetical protein